MAKITYANKSYINLNSNVADANKVNASDMNEIKSVVNTNYDEQKSDVENLYYKSGDVIELGSTNPANEIVCSGYITTSSTNVFIHVITPKRLDNITAITVNNLTVEGRCQFGYLNNTSGFNEYANTSGYTIIANVATSNSITIKITKSSVWTYGSSDTQVNNNTLICMNGYVKMTLS